MLAHTRFSTPAQISGKEIAHLNGNRRSVAAKLYAGTLRPTRLTAEQVGHLCKVPTYAVRRLAKPLRGNRSASPAFEAALAWSALSPAEKTAFGLLVGTGPLFDLSVVPALR
jgi:hypothetical protein